MSKERFIKPFFLLSVTLVLVIFFANRSLPEVLERRLADLPRNIDVWEGEDFGFDQLIIDELDADVSVARYYRNGSANVITLYIGYYGTRKGGRTGHNPNSCYPSSGWTILSDTDTGIADGTVNRLSVRKGNRKRLVYHWYQNRNKIIYSGLQHNMARFVHRVRYNRDDGAFVRISLADNGDGTEEVLQGFGRLLIPLVAQYWPVEG